MGGWSGDGWMDGGRVVGGWWWVGTRTSTSTGTCKYHQSLSIMSIKIFHIINYKNSVYHDRFTEIYFIAIHIFVVNVYSECNICLACGVGVCIPITCLACNNGVYYIECQKHIESSPKAIPSTPAARTPPPSDINR